MTAEKGPEPGLQPLVDQITANVRSDLGPHASLPEVRDEVQRRVRAYLRSPERRERLAHARRERLREESGDRALLVLDILIAHDPARLIAAGAPPEQYATEAGPIAERLQHVDSRTEAVRIVQDVLDEYLHTHRAETQELGADVWEAWNRS